jgi:Mor family transcriptional regulator
MNKKWHKPKLSIENAQVVRERFLEGESIHSLAKRFELSRVSIKGILKAETYNKFGEHTNLLANKKATGLF